MVALEHKPDTTCAWRGYDPVGNRVTRNFDGNPITWTYDDLYRLTGQAKAGQVCTYTMDGIDLSGATTTILWDGTDYLEDRF